jgi:hypothetical protein
VQAAQAWVLALQLEAAARLARRWRQQELVREA